MRLSVLCRLDLHYTSDFHLVTPYGNESGIGWGIGEGTVTGDRLAGTVSWSNHPGRRGDGVMLPNARGVITTDDGAEVMLDLSGRTLLPEVGVGRQQLFVLLESEHPSYAWLNEVVCVGEGRIDPSHVDAAIDVFVCEQDR